MNRPTNIYELLGDENDEEIKKVPQAAATKKEEPKKTAPQAKPAKSTQVTEQKGKESRPPRQDRADRKPREFGQDAQVGEGGFERKGGNRPPRQQRDRDPERRQRVAEASARGGNRVFDRRSGTGRGREGKRNGAGRGNWGTTQDDQKAQVEETETTGTQEGGVAETKEAAEQQQQPQAEQQQQDAPKEEEEEDKTKTLEEYMKELKKPAVALPEARRTVEVTNPKWKEYTPLTRSFDDEGFLFKGDEQQTKAGKKDAQDAKKSGVRADEVLNFTEGSPKSSFRGGRGGSRGGRGGARGGRGGPARGGRSGPAPNFSDKSAFPDLATKA